MATSVLDLSVENTRHKSKEKHNTRRYKESKNKNIKKEITPENKTYELRSRMEILEECFAEKMARVNKNRNNKGPRKKYKDVNEYQKSSERFNNEITAVAQWGDKKNYEMIANFLKNKRNLNEQDIRHAFAEGYRKYFEGFNERNKGFFQVSKVYVHVDESTPHAHADMFVTTKLDNGDPSTSRWRALAKKYDKNYKDLSPLECKQLAAKFREEEDQFIADHVFNEVNSFYCAKTKRKLNEKYGFVERRTEKEPDYVAGREHNEYIRDQIQKDINVLKNDKVKLQKEKTQLEADKNELVPKISTLKKEKEELDNQIASRKLMAEKYDEKVDGFLKGDEAARQDAIKQLKKQEKVKKEAREALKADSEFRNSVERALALECYDDGTRESILDNVENALYNKYYDEFEWELQPMLDNAREKTNRKLKQDELLNWEQQLASTAYREQMEINELKKKVGKGAKQQDSGLEI